MVGRNHVSFETQLVTELNRLLCRSKHKKFPPVERDSDSILRVMLPNTVDVEGAAMLVYEETKHVKGFAYVPGGIDRSRCSLRLEDDGIVTLYVRIGK